MVVVCVAQEGPATVVMLSHYRGVRGETLVLAE
jgi:hypothetical protein